MTLPEFIPATMMTQHPDSASRYVPVRDEPREAIDALTPQPIGLGLEEVMVDYEGKLTPYHQTAEISLGLNERGQVPGRDVLVTPRIPSATKETAFHQLMALMSVIESNFQLTTAGSGGAISEVVVPMVETAAELVDVRRRIQDVIELGHKEFGISSDPDAVQVIPLIEEVPELFGAGAMLGLYLTKAPAAGYGVSRLRVMLGRSDSAMAYGLVPSVLAVKAAISDCYALGRERGVPVYPILGGGALPFRGHVDLANFDQLLVDFAGVRTVTVQSGLRYDFGGEVSQQVAIKAHDKLAATEPLAYTDGDRQRITALAGLFTEPYLESFSDLLPAVIAISEIVPRQRDRLARKSAVGYARAAADPAKLAEQISDAAIASRLKAINPPRAKNLPRAISFTGALYSIGLPPEFIGTGRGLAAVSRLYGADGVDFLLKIYPGLRQDLAKAGRYLNLKTAAMHLPDGLISNLIADVEEASARLDIAVGPVTAEDQRYHVLLETVQPMLKQLVSQGGDWSAEAADQKLVTEWICRLGRLRGSLG
ncbi:MAG: phosphoenolpyruvate carboxylase [Actinobacteria bacterium]|nr:phosphoenolpyruvate carboxylase [Actinomycetota bacterium]